MTLRDVFNAILDQPLWITALIFFMPMIIRGVVFPFLRWLSRP